MSDFGITQFERAWIRARRMGGMANKVSDVAGEEDAKALAEMFWRYGVMYERGELILNPDGSAYED